MGVYFNGYQWERDLDSLTCSSSQTTIPLADPLYHIIQGFKAAVDKNQAAYTTPLIARKIHCLSQRKALYYEQNRWGFLLKIFSMLRNFVLFGYLKTSAELGLEWSKPRLAEPEEEQELESFIDDASESDSDSDEEIEFFDAREVLQSPHTEVLTPILSPREQFNEAIIKLGIWQIGDEEKMAHVLEIFSLIFKGAEIVSIDASQPNQIVVDLQDVVKGTFNQLTEVSLGPQHTITFSQENGAKVCNFAPPSIALTVGMWPVTKQFSLKTVKLWPDGNVTATAIAFGQTLSHTLTIEDALDVWSRVQWPSE